MRGPLSLLSQLLPALWIFYPDYLPSHLHPILNHVLFKSLFFLKYTPNYPYGENKYGNEVKLILLHYSDLFVTDRVPMLRFSLIKFLDTDYFFH